MQTTSSNALASFLDDLAADLSKTLRQAARLAERIQDPDAGLPPGPVLRLRPIARHRNISTTTAWRRALRGDFGPIISKPGEPIEVTREGYLNSLRAQPAQRQPAVKLATSSRRPPVEPGRTPETLDRTDFGRAH